MCRPATSIRSRTKRYEQPGPHPAVPEAHRGSACRSSHHGSDGERRRTVRLRGARGCGDEISETQPLLDARLEDGSRVAAMFPPCAVTGPILTIRKFTRRYSLEDLVT